LFHIDQENVLRCDVYVPQSQFAGIHEALDAAVTVPELPGRVFRAKVSRSSASLAQNSRSMLVEIDIPNDDGVLAPGLYVNVAFDIARTSPAVVVADATLIFDAKGLHVAIVTEDQRIRMAPVVVARDFGEKAELREGLKGGEALVMNPPPDLEDGQKVHVASGQSSRGQGGGKSKS
jgi:HlyD family secretion protein